MTRSIIALLLLLIVSSVSAGRPNPNMAQLMGGQWYNNYANNEEEVESNRRKGAKKTKEVSAKGRPSKAEAKKDDKKDEHPGWFQLISENIEDGLMGLE